MRDATQTRERIETEALRLFVEKGVSETTTRDIAKAAGVSEGGIYVHFHSKDGLVRELFRRHYTAYGGQLAALAAQGGSVKSRLDRIVHAFCELFDRDPLLFRFLLLVQHDQLNRLEPNGTNPVEVLRSLILQGMKSGEIRKTDPDLMTAIVMGIVLQPATFKAYGRIRKSFRRMADELSETCWRALPK